MLSSCFCTGCSLIHIRIIIDPRAFRMVFFRNHFFIRIGTVFSFASVFFIAFLRADAVYDNRIAELMSQCCDFVFFHDSVADGAGVGISSFFGASRFFGDDKVALGMSLGSDCPALCIPTGCTFSCLFPCCRTSGYFYCRPASVIMSFGSDHAGLFRPATVGTLFIDMPCRSTGGIFYALLVVMMSGGIHRLDIVRTADRAMIFVITIVLTGSICTGIHHIDVIMRNDRQHFPCQDRSTIRTSGFP